MTKNCIKCGNEIHPLRIKVLPNTTTCVECSTTTSKQGRPVMRGNVAKDDNWVDIEFID
jgi:RNA polymerase-binding transcription factor DksA